MDHIDDSAMNFNDSLGADGLPPSRGAVMREVGSIVAEQLRGVPIVALGSHCYTSWMLKQAGLKRSSWPFDWLFSGLSLVSHCLDDDFKTFLDASHFETVPVGERLHPHVNKGHHAYYRRTFGVDHMFNHHDPAGNPDDSAYFVRAVERVRAAGRSEDPIVLVTTFGNGEQASVEFRDLESAVRRYFRRPMLVAAGVGPIADLPAFVIESTSDMSIRLTFSPTSVWHPLAFEALSDDVALLSAIGGVAARHLGRG